MILRLAEEGVDPAILARASGVEVDDLLALPGLPRRQPPSEQELGAKAAALAYRALEEGERIFDEGSEPTRIRLIAALAGHPMRRMQTDLGEQEAKLQTLLHQILSGGRVIDDEPEVVDDTEGDQP
jgi:hypothetical protein